MVRFLSLPGLRTCTEFCSHAPDYRGVEPGLLTLPNLDGLVMPLGLLPSVLLNQGKNDRPFFSLRLHGANVKTVAHSLKLPTKICQTLVILITFHHLRKPTIGIPCLIHLAEALITGGGRQQTNKTGLSRQKMTFLRIQ